MREPIDRSVRSGRPVVARRALLGFGLLAALASPGCFYGGRGNFAFRYGGNMPIDLLNDTGQQVCYVNMGPSTEPNWGHDWLGPTETMAPGVVRRFGIFGAVDWDIRVLDCGHRVIATQLHIPVRGPSVISLQSMTVIAQAQ